MLWDIGLKVGYVVCELVQCKVLVVEEVSVFISLFDVCWLVGDLVLDVVLCGIVDDFVLWLLCVYFGVWLVECNVCYVCFDDIVYNFEFNFKDGFGGLCMFDLLCWLGLCLVYVDGFDVMVVEGLFDLVECVMLVEVEVMLCCYCFVLYLEVGWLEEWLLFDFQCGFVV